MQNNKCSHVYLDLECSLNLLSCHSPEIRIRPTECMYYAVTCNPRLSASCSCCWQQNTLHLHTDQIP